MKVEPFTVAGRPLLVAYGGGGFRFGTQAGDLRIEGSALILADSPQPWPVAALSMLTESDMEPVLALAGQIEFLLLGTGPKLVPPPPFLRSRLKEKAIGLEMMDTPAACRAYNHLASEGRHFAAALLSVDTSNP